MHPTFTLAPFNSDLYKQSLALREHVLRKPLGMLNRPEDVAHDHTQEHLVALLNQQVVATVSLVPQDQEHIKLRQMAVSDVCQGKGVGAALIREVHRIALSRNIAHIALNARGEAIGFYQKLGYVAVGELFEEIGITHQRMQWHASPDSR